MWNLVKLAGYGKSAGKATRSQQKKPLRNGGTRSRVTRCRGFEQLEGRALMSAMPVWPCVVPLGRSAAYVTGAKAIPKINVVDLGGAYNGLAFPATVTVTGGKGPAAKSLEGVTPTVTYCLGNSCSSTPPTKAGTYTVTANFPGSKDYAAVKSSPVTFTIAKATPTVHVTDAGGTYNGLPFPATVTVTGSSGSAAASFESLSPTLIGPVLPKQQRPLSAASLEGVTPMVTYCLGNSCSSTPPTKAGTYTVIANFPGSADYAAVKSAPVTFTIVKATPTLHVTDVGGVYNGLAFPATLTVMGGKGSAATSLEGVTPTVIYCHGNSCSSTPPIQPGTYTASANFPGSADYAAAKSTPVTFTIIPGIVTVTAANFQQQVIESPVPVLVDFTAVWCEWCQKEAPILEQLAQDRTDIKVVEIDYDANPSLVQQFNVNAIPRLLLFKNGQKVADTLGYQTESQLLGMLS
ncbi:MAG: thioredoxin domain-containing protein [Thermoguttaceae bacterium]